MLKRLLNYYQMYPSADNYSMRRKYMKIMRKLTVALLVMALMVMLFPMASILADEGTVVIFHTNDIHGRAEGSDPTDPDDKGTIIGYARYKTIIDEAKVAEAPERVLVFDAGDVSHGTNFATLTNGESIIELMNAVGVDAMTCGNHEFNYGPVQLKKLETLADFPIMAANIVKTDKSPFFAVNSKTFEPMAGVKIGIFGVDTPETKVKSHPDNTKGLAFGAGDKDNDLDAFAEVCQTQIDALVADGCTFVIMMAHVGIDSESDIRTDLLIPKLQGLHLVIDGHSHSTLKEGMKVKDLKDKEVLIVQAGSHFANIGKVTLQFDGAALKSMTPELLTFDAVKGTVENPAIKAKIDAFNAVNDGILGEVIGNTATELDGERNHVRAGETNLGNLHVDAIFKNAGADVVLSNGGNIRRSIPAGPITMGVALEVLPFQNMVTVIRVTGQDIVDALTHGAGAYPGTAGGFPHVAGMSYVIVTQGIGEDEKFVKVDDVKVGGDPIDLKASYTLATNDFLAAGGDGYTMFADAEEVSLLGLMLDFFAEELGELSKDGPFTYGTDGRITVKQLGEMEPTIPTGESMTYVMVGTGTIMLAVAALVIARKRKVTDS